MTEKNVIDANYPMIIDKQSELIDRLLKSDEKKGKYEVIKWVANCIMICVISVTFIICYFYSSYNTSSYNNNTITQVDSNFNTKGDVDK